VTINNALPADTPQERDLLLTALRAASIRSRLIATEIDTVGISLRHHKVTCEQAMAWLKEQDLLGWLHLGPEARS
jgi:hypothetical protein